MPVTETLIIDRILNTVELRRASDVHFVVGSYPYIRVAGKLEQLTTEKLIDNEFIKVLLEYFFGKKDFSSAEFKEQRVIFCRNENSCLRVDAYLQKGDWALTIKKINDRIPNIDSLPYGNLLKPLVDGHGLIILSGPYNSGKSTACAASLQYINKNLSKRIVSIENPIEHLFINDRSIVEQRQVGRDISDIAEGLKQAIDQDVDIVIVNQVDSHDVVEQILKLVSAKKLVIAVADYLSVVNCLTTWQGFFDLDEQVWFNQVISDALKLIVVQDYVPALLTGDQVLITEIMNNDDVVVEALASGKFAQLDTMLNTSVLPTLLSFDNALIDALSKGLIVKETALSKAHDQNYVKGKISTHY